MWEWYWILFRPSLILYLWDRLFLTNQKMVFATVPLATKKGRVHTSHGCIAKPRNKSLEHFNDRFFQLLISVLSPLTNGSVPSGTFFSSRQWLHGVSCSKDGLWNLLLADKISVWTSREFILWIIYSSAITKECKYVCNYCGFPNTSVDKLSCPSVGFGQVW